MRRPQRQLTGESIMLCFVPGREQHTDLEAFIVACRCKPWRRQPPLQRIAKDPMTRILGQYAGGSSW